MIAARLLERLDKVRELGPGRWMATCPAHQDRSPSLSIREVEDRVLICDHGGCTAEAVLAALGLTFADLFPHDPWAASREAAYAAHISKPRLDPLDLEQMIVDLAEAQLEAGNALSLEDQARVNLAVERLNARSAAA